MCPYPYYPTTLCTREYLPSVVLGGTIVLRKSINLSMEGFKRSRSIHIQVLSDALPLKGVPTRVTRVANRCARKYHLYLLDV
jgi:hypothetical protein